MTDLKITKLCAEAMGFIVKGSTTSGGNALLCYSTQRGHFDYNPLHDDAQAMALVKTIKPCVQPPDVIGDGTWHVWFFTIPNYTAVSGDLNRAICECVAKMQASKC